MVDRWNEREGRWRARNDDRDDSETFEHHRRGYEDAHREDDDRAWRRRVEAYYGATASDRRERGSPDDRYYRRDLGERERARGSNSREAASRDNGDYRHGLGWAGGAYGGNDPGYGVGHAGGAWSGNDEVSRSRPMEWRSGSDRDARDRDRGWLDRAGDEIRSWFGDEDANVRRHEDVYRGRGPKGYSRSDERIREDICDRLTEDPRLDASDVEVQVERGEVTLSGHVRDRPSKRRAEDMTEAVSGVTNVQNNLRISAPT